MNSVRVDGGGLPARGGHPPAVRDLLRGGESLLILVALLVCLIPTTIGALLSAIGIAGMDRLVQHNVIAVSGRAVEAAGDVETLLLDKTGTITLGNRQAVEFLPVHVPAETSRTLQLASLPDETPEGRSIVVLAKERFGLGDGPPPATTAGRDDLRPVFGRDPDERRQLRRPPLRKGAPTRSAAGCGEPAASCRRDRPGGRVNRRQGVHRLSWPSGKMAAHAYSGLSLKDIVKGGMHERFDRLRTMGIRTVMITVFALFALGPMGLGAAGYGVFLALFGVGSLVGTTIAAPVERRLGTARTLLVSAFIGSLTYFVPAVTAHPLPIGVAIVVAGTTALMWGVVNVSLRQRSCRARSTDGCNPVIVSLRTSRGCWAQRRPGSPRRSPGCPPRSSSRARPACSPVSAGSGSTTGRSRQPWPSRPIRGSPRRPPRCSGSTAGRRDVSDRVVVLSTERLDLRRFTWDDVDRLVALDSDPDVTFFVTGGVPEFEPDFLAAYLRYYERYEGYGFWAVEERATGDFIGWFHLRPEPGTPEDEPELGYRFVKSAWGKGYATEGSRALIDRAFRRARRAAGPRVDDGREHGLAPGDGEGRAALRADVLRGLAGAHPGRRARRRRVRDHPRGVAGRPGGRRATCLRRRPVRRASVAFGLSVRT